MFCDVGGEINQFEGDASLSSLMDWVTARVRPMLSDALNGALDVNGKKGLMSRARATVASASDNIGRTELSTKLRGENDGEENQGRFLRGRNVLDAEGNTKLSAKRGYVNRPGSESGLAQGRGRVTNLSEDSEGRIIEKSLRDKLRDTAIVDNLGRPLAVYHGTGTEFDRFEISNDIGFHFGDREQAEDRVKAKKIKNPTYTNTMVKKVTIVQLKRLLSGLSIPNS